MTAGGDEPIKSILAYTDRISVAPGQTLEVKVSVEDDAPTFEATFVRLFCTDDDPMGPGLEADPVGAAAAGTYPARRQPIQTGSCLVVALTDRASFDQGFTWRANVWPTLPGAGRQALLGHWREDRERGALLEIDGTGSACLRLGNGSGPAFELSVGRAMHARRWYTVWATYDPRTGRAAVGQQAWRPLVDRGDEGEAEADCSIVPQIEDDQPLIVAAWLAGDARFGGHLNGKIDRPRWASRRLAAGDITELGCYRVPDRLAPAMVAAWDFALETPTGRIVDTGPNGLHGHTVNLPARAMTGPQWDGTSQRWSDMPEHYGAIHFHADDLADAGWQTDLAWTLPDDLPSGVYGVRLATASGEDIVPFFVRPPRGQPAAKIAYLAATATYIAYGNFHEIGKGEKRKPPSASGGGSVVLTMEDAFLYARREYAGSTYCLHGDGSGRCYSSRLRPLLSMRLNMPVWSFDGDGFLLSWLRREGVEVDVITDEDLHLEGSALLADYRVVMTGCHPEYYSGEMLDAMDGFLAAGGRLMYLGGNGFYWRIAHARDQTGIIEVRRAEDGPRAWEAEPGEYYSSFSGEYGGLWRRNGRPPNLLAGVGFCAQGFHLGSYYRRTEACRDPRAAFIFGGIDDELIGDFGLHGGGAAGQELDRADILLGTPPHALVVARSERHTDEIILTKEEYLDTMPSPGGAANPDLVHADMTFFETMAGGAVFSVGSISWCASLPWNGFDNNVARVTGNVLRRFLDAAPFSPPGSQSAS